MLMLMLMLRYRWWWLGILGGGGVQMFNGLDGLLSGSGLGGGESPLSHLLANFLVPLPHVPSINRRGL